MTERPPKKKGQVRCSHYVDCILCIFGLMQCALKSEAKLLWTEHWKIKPLWRLDPKSVLTKPVFYCRWKLYKLWEEDRSGSEFLFLSILWLLALNRGEKNETFPWLQRLWCHLCCIFYSLLFRFLSELVLICSPFIAYSSPIGFPAAHFTVTAWITFLYLGQSLLTPCIVYLSKHCAVWF